jgi:glycosyltransferase involved in cell wall biosynthesis
MKTLKNNPEISVVMSVYNGGDFLSIAIESILNQTFTNFEFIIIDDGSTDNSRLIIKSYKDKRIKLVAQTNQGLVKSLNRGLSLATGKYIARMDADDISLPERLDKQLKVAKRTGAALIGCSFAYLDQYNRPLVVQAVASDNQSIKRSLYVGNPFSHGSSLFLASAVRDLGAYRDDVGPVEDYDLWLRLAPHYKFAACSDVLYHWRMNPQGISYTSSGDQVKGAAHLRLGYINAHPFRHAPVLKTLKSYRGLKHGSNEVDQILGYQLVREQYLILKLTQKPWSRLKAISTFMLMFPENVRLLKKLTKDRIRPRYHSMRKIAKRAMGRE